jgi:esterase/lipase
MAVSRDVEEKTGVHPEELDVLAQINKNTSRRIMFLAAKDDKMVHYTHAEILFDKYKGAAKKLMLFEGTHHSDRPVDVLFEAFAFIDSSLYPADSLPN